MATKIDCFYLKDNPESVTVHNCQTVHGNQYSNLNLNQNLKCLDLSPIQSSSKSYNNKNCGTAATLNLPGSSVSDNIEGRENPLHLNKPLKSSDFSNLINDNTENEEFKKLWKTNSYSNTINSSTISLHIAAYENSVETNSFNGSNNEDLQKEKSGSVKNDTTGIFVIQNSFEFPRQEKEGAKVPEVSNYKASQRLLNPNKASKMSDGSEEENASVDSLATVFQHLGTNDIPTEAPVLTIQLHHIYDDFYHNPLDWSSQNIVSCIDDADVYIVSPSADPQIRKVSENGNAVSTKFSPDGRLLAVGTYSGVLEVYDVETNQLVWDNKVHDCRIGCLAWKGNDLIFTGSRDRTINANALGSKAYVQIGSHSQEVCGMRVSQSNDKLVTGGNDNMIKIWNISNLSKAPSDGDYGDEGLPLHKSAIKALDFSPSVNGVIATGGGCNDGRIFVWNVANREIFKEIEIDKQITNLHWLPSGKEIVSTYGFGWNRNHKFNIEHNCIDIWSFETLKVVQRFEGHRGRVLFSAMAPNKSGFVTAASDNVLKFWKPNQ